MKIFLNRRILLHFFICLWILGTFLSCSKSPSGELVQKVKSILAVVEDYRYGQSRNWLQDYNDVMKEVYNYTRVHERVERLMINTLRSKATIEAKQIVCNSLVGFASTSSLTTLEKLVSEPATSMMALKVFAQFPGQKVDTLLIRLLDESEDQIKIGVINTLVLRNNITSPDPFISYLHVPNEELSKCAIQAMGNIGGEKAAGLLYEEFLKAEANIKWLLGDALVTNLKRYKQANSKDMLQVIFDADPPISLRYAVFKEILVTTSEDEQLELLWITIKGSDPDFQLALVRLLRELPSNISLESVIPDLAGLVDPVRSAVTLAFADRKDATIRPTLLSHLKSKDAKQRIIALEGLKNISKPSDILMLARVAAYSTIKERELARECLYWMEGEEVTERVMAIMVNQSGTVEVELIKCIGYRKIYEGYALVLDRLNDDESSVRTEAIRTIGMIGNPQSLHTVIDKTFQKLTDKDREVALESLTSIALRYNDPAKGIQIVQPMLKEYQDALHRRVLLGLVGSIGGGEALQIILEYLDDENVDLQLKCIELLSTWEDDSTLPILEKLMAQELPQRNKTQVFAGVVNLAQQSRTLTSNEKSERIINAFQHAEMEQDKKILISGISRIVSLAALDFVIAQLGTELNQQVVQESLIRIADNLRYSQMEEVVVKIDELVAKVEDREFIDKLIILKRSMLL